MYCYFIINTLENQQTSSNVSVMGKSTSQFGLHCDGIT